MSSSAASAGQTSTPSTSAVGKVADEIAAAMGAGDHPSLTATYAD